MFKGQTSSIGYFLKKCIALHWHQKANVDFEKEDYGELHIELIQMF